MNNAKQDDGKIAVDAAGDTFLPSLLVLATVALSAIAGEIALPWIQQTVMVFFIAAVVFNSWLNGLKAGLFAAVLVYHRGPFHKLPQ